MVPRCAPRNAIAVFDGISMQNKPRSTAKKSSLKHVFRVLSEVLYLAQNGTMFRLSSKDFE